MFLLETAAAEVCMAAYARVHVHCSSDPAHGLSDKIAGLQHEMHACACTTVLAASYVPPH